MSSTRDTDPSELELPVEGGELVTADVDPLCPICKGSRVFVTRAQVGGSGEARFDHCVTCRGTGQVAHYVLEDWQRRNPMVQCLEDELTPVTVPEVYAALERAWVSKNNEIPSRASLLVLLAQWAEETGRGKSIHRFNIANIKWTSGCGFDYTMFRCSEVIDGVERFFDPPHPATWFRAYPDLDTGAADYLDELERRFVHAWPAVLAGDPRQFAKLLKEAGYYTADETLYENAVASLDAEFDRTVPPDVDQAPDSTRIGGIHDYPGPNDDGSSS